MPILHKKVFCTSCSKSVRMGEARLLNPFEKEKRYECFDCFKKETKTGLKVLEKRPVRRDLFCKSCRYKFRSMKLVCPYCGKSDYLTESDVSAADLV